MTGLHGVTKIHFSRPKPGREVVPLALACGVGVPSQWTRDALSAYQSLLQQGPSLWLASDLASAEVAVYANKYDASVEAHTFAGAAREAGIDCPFFDTGDGITPYQPPYGKVYPTSIRSDLPQSYEVPVV